MSGIFGGAAAADGAGVRQDFRGLSLRTHPDADVAKSKVMLVHADEIVFDDGARVTSGLDRLVADVTASGAGGLDTGAEGASRWYEIYAIRKSSDGTLNLLLHRALNRASDTAFTTAPDASRALRRATSTATDKLAQGLQFANAKPFPYVDVQLVRAGSVVGNIWFTLEADTAGNPSGTPLATSDKIDASQIATSNQIVRIPFRNPYTAATATQYHLVLQGDYTRSDAVNIAWRGVAAGGYANGIAKEYTGAAWGAASGVGDFYFTAYTELNAAALTYPTGYDAKCLIGWVYNDGSSNFVEFIARDRQVAFIFGYVILSGGVATFPTLLDTSPAVPPVPIMASSWELSQTVLGAVIELSPDLSPDSKYGIYWQQSGAGYYVIIGAVVPLEYNTLYYLVNSGAGTVWINAFSW
jgi:hypothetical protein